MARLAILKNETTDFKLWVESLEKRDLKNYRIIDLTTHDWLNSIVEYNPDFLLTKPPGITSLFKQLYDERLYILSSRFNLKMYPSFEEVLLYENKRLLSYWLKAWIKILAAFSPEGGYSYQASNSAQVTG